MTLPRSTDRKNPPVYTGGHLSPASALYPAATNLLCGLALLAGAITIGAIAYIVVLGYTPMPFWDQWQEISVLARQTPTLHWLWEQHNEHRILLPKLFLVGDDYLFHAEQKFLLASIVATQLAFLALLSWSFRGFGNMRGAIWGTCVGVAACFVFNPNQMENFGQGFQIAFILQNFFTALSFATLLMSAQGGRDGSTQAGPRTRAQNSVRWWWLAISVLSAAAGMYSLAGGIVAWPILLITAIALRMPGKAIALLFLSACGFVASYLFHYISPPWHTAPLDALRHPLALAEYVATCFGATFFDARLRMDLWTGLIGLVLSLVIVPIALRSRSRLAIYLAMLQAACVGTALLAAIGRLNFGMIQATLSRYQTFAVGFWLAPTILLLLTAANARHKIFIPAAQILILLTGATALARIRPAEQHAMEQFRRDGILAAALAAGVVDRDLALTTYPDPQVVFQAIPLLERNHWSVFHTSEFTNIGKRFADLYGPVSESACLGAVNTLAPAGSPGHYGLRLAGWAVERSTMRAPPSIVPTVNGVIAGAAVIGIFRPEIKHAVKARSGSIGWEAFVHDVPPSSPITLYGVSRKNQVCVVATTSTP